MSLAIKQIDRICLITVAVVSLACAYMVAGASLREKGLIRQAEEKLSRGLQDLKLAEVRLQGLNGVMGAARDEIRLLNERIPESAEIGDFFSRLDVLLKQNRVSLISVQPLPGVKGKLFTRIPVRFLIHGSFNRIFNLIGDLETMQRAVVMEKISITRTGTGRECRADMTAFIFER